MTNFISRRVQMKAFKITSTHFSNIPAEPPLLPALSARVRTPAFAIINNCKE